MFGRLRNDRNKCKHEFPSPHEWKNCVIRCTRCGSFFEAVFFAMGGSNDWQWRRRSGRWNRQEVRRIERRVRREQ